MEDKITKVTELRNNEYYFEQELLDFLYKRSEQGYYFYNLIDRIITENNIRLAYRNIKTNKGSKTNGLSGKNMSYIASMKLKAYIKLIKKSILNYKPAKIKRIGIPKPNGKTRYLGIKEPIDKIIEQAIYQILEPILTAKFHNNSNGFIKGRSCTRAIAQFNNYIIKEKLYYIIDLDIKGFFDNVDHGKLLKQLWTCGIRDKNLLSLISKMLKAEIHKVGIPEKGTPQGGILSPLLANVVLNEFDWWLESKKNKGIRFVRYADDVKILCPTYSIARDMMDKTTKWLGRRLSLNVSLEKTKIVNIKRNYSHFLGCKIKVKIKDNKAKIISHMADKAIESCEKKVKRQIRIVKKKQNNKTRCEKEIDLYNSIVSGIHNYYDMNTEISQDLNKIDFVINNFINNNLSKVLTFSNKSTEENFITKKYGKDKTLPYIRGKPLIPIGRIEYEKPRYRGNKINYFEEKSRKNFHKNLEIQNLFILEKLVETPMYQETVEFNDNSISKFCGQFGKYSITNKPICDLTNLSIIKINKNKGSRYDNIMLVTNKIKKLIMIKETDDMIEISRLKSGLTNEQLSRINLIRKENNLSSI